MHTFTTEEELAQHEADVRMPGTLVLCDSGMFMLKASDSELYRLVERRIALRLDNADPVAQQWDLALLFEDGIGYVHNSDLHFLHIIGRVA